MWNIQGYPWVNVNIDVEFSHHECRSLSERVENPWVFHIHVNVKTLGESHRQMSIFGQRSIVGQSTGEKTLRRSTTHTTLGWLVEPSTWKKSKRVGKSLEPSIITYNYPFLDIKTSLKPSLLVIIVILGSQHWWNTLKWQETNPSLPSRTTGKKRKLWSLWR